MSGLFSWMLVPFLRGIIDSIFEPGVRGIRFQKSAQIGWSESVLCNLLGYIIDMMPAPMIVLFPKMEKGKEFNLERFEPMVESTPRLADKVPLKSREKGVTQTFKLFPGGWMKFVGSHSPDAVKSSSARYVFVEEPDDCETDAKGQGSTIKLLRERLKNYFDTLSVMGGTPTLKGLSAMEAEMELTDKRRWFVPCHHCHEAAPLSWDNVKWPQDESKNHPVYGNALPQQAYYVCPHCGATWTDAERARNARLAEENGGGWRATAPFTGLAGFYGDDLMSSFAGAALPTLVEKYLEAVHKANQGDIKALVEFWNNQLGLAFEYKSPAPEVEDLERRSEDYPELTVPWGGLRLSCGVDVQGNRIAIVVVAWGRGDESWRVYWGEIYGEPSDENDPAWTELENFLFRPYRHASGAELHIEKTTIDSGDGNTSDAVYNFCRRHKWRGVMPGKGVESGEIYRVPKPIDPGRRNKAARYGLAAFLVGTERAKDLIIGFGEHGGRLRLCEDREKGITGTGPGRMHWYRGIRGDYFKQLTSEVKAPRKGAARNKLYWQCKQGVRNEALDCEVYALHAARAMKINLMTESQWRVIEEKIRQPDLIALAAAPVSPAVPQYESQRITPATTAPEKPEGAEQDDKSSAAPSVPPAAPVTQAPVRPKSRMAEMLALQLKASGERETAHTDAPY